MLGHAFHPSRRAAVGILVFAVALQACGTDITDVGYPTNPLFVLTVGTSEIPVTAGATATTFIKASRSGGLTGDIIFSITGARDGLAATVVTTAVADSFALVIDASMTLPEATYPIVVSAVATGAPAQHETFAVTVRAPVGSPPVFDQVFAGAHACALTTTGAAYCWGYNGHGELGNGDTSIVNPTPIAVSGGLSFQTLSVSKVDGVTCGLTPSGAAYCWGHNAGGQLGDGTKTDRLTPTPVDGGLTFTSIAVGTSHACGVAENGTAYCWGTTPNGAFGDGTAGVHLTPTATVAGFIFESIVAGSDYTCAVTIAGDAYCWGLGVQGQLGNGAALMRTTPTPVSGGLTFLGLAAGGLSTCGVTTERKAYCWGNNSFGTLGDSTLSRRLAPVAVSGGLTFQSISAGFQTMCGVTDAGAGYCWGYNFGALGDGTSEHRSTPVAVTGGLQLRRISAGTGFSCGVTTAGAVYCWGDNSTGQLGDGTTRASETPVLVRWRSHLSP